jgi:hypothetical protein
MITLQGPWASYADAPAWEATGRAVGPSTVEVLTVDIQLPGGPAPGQRWVLWTNGQIEKWAPEAHDLAATTTYGRARGATSQWRKVMLS